MKVLHVSCEGLGKAGVQSVIMAICRNLPETRFDILLFTEEKRYYEEEFISLGGKIYRIPNYEGPNDTLRRMDFYLRFFRIFWGTWKILKTEGPFDAVHCHNNLESGICNLAALLAGVKVRISHSHTASDYFSSRKFGNIPYIYRLFLQRLTHLTSNAKLACTEKSFISLFGQKYLRRKGSQIIMNPVDFKEFQREKPRDTHKVLGKNIVHVGRFDENKNQEFILDMFPYILEEIPEAGVTFVGFGEEYLRRLANKAGSLGISRYVRFLPFDSDVKNILETADLFIFPSIREGFGIVLIEAQSMEVPCLVSDSVPQEVDCGLCRFIPLSSGAEVWAEEAIKLMKQGCLLRLDLEKLQNFGTEKFVNKISIIYRGEFN